MSESPVSAPLPSGRGHRRCDLLGLTADCEFKRLHRACDRDHVRCDHDLGDEPTGIPATTSTTRASACSLDRSSSIRKRAPIRRKVLLPDRQRRVRLPAGRRDDKAHQLLVARRCPIFPQRRPDALRDGDAWLFPSRPGALPTSRTLRHLSRLLNLARVLGGDRVKFAKPAWFRRLEQKSEDGHQASPLLRTRPRVITTFRESG